MPWQRSCSAMALYDLGCNTWNLTSGRTDLSVFRLGGRCGSAMVPTRFDHSNPRPMGHSRISCGDGPRKPLTRARIANNVCLGAECRSNHWISRGAAPSNVQILYWTPSGAQGCVLISGGKCGQRPSYSTLGKYYVRVEPPAPQTRSLNFTRQTDRLPCISKGLGL